MNQASSINSKAFANNSKIDFYSCNAACSNVNGDNLVKNVSSLLPNTTVSGASGLTTYDFIYTGISLWQKLQRYLNNGVAPARELPKPTKETGVSEWHTYKMV